MGWVEDKFQYESDLKRFIPQLWDEMRDHIGVAVAEFNAHTSDAAANHLEAKDCTSMGPHCRRVSKQHGEVSIEVFLQEKRKTLDLKLPNGTFKTICEYGIKQDRTGAEFLSACGPVSAEYACRMALEEFIFGS